MVVRCPVVFLWSSPQQWSAFPQWYVAVDVWKDPMWNDLLRINPSAKWQSHVSQTCVSCEFGSTNRYGETGMDTNWELALDETVMAWTTRANP